MECGWLGNQGRIGEDRLVQGTIHCCIQGLPHWRMRVVSECQVLCHSRTTLVGSKGIPGSWCLSVSSSEMGSREIHNLQLLCWSKKVSYNGTRVQERSRRLVWSIEMVNLDYGFTTPFYSNPIFIVVSLYLQFLHCMSDSSCILHLCIIDPSSGLWCCQHLQNHIYFNMHLTVWGLFTPITGLFYFHSQIN